MGPGLVLLLHQKCLGAPPGISPVAISQRALARIRCAHAAGALLVRHRPAAQLLGGAAHDLSPHDADPAVLRAVRGRPAGARGGAGGPVGAARRRRRATSRPGCGSGASGCWPNPTTSWPQLSAVRVPEGVDGKEVQPGFCASTASRSAAGWGPMRPPIWRVGLMGVNANRETADRVLAAFDAVLAPTRTAVHGGQRLMRCVSVCTAASLRSPAERAARWRSPPRWAPTSSSSTWRTQSPPTTRSGPART